MLRNILAAIALAIVGPAIGAILYVVVKVAFWRAGS